MGMGADMTGASLLPLFVLACAGGYAVARPVPGYGGQSFGDPSWLARIGSPAAIIIVGALIASAEAGSAAARYLALFALLCASAATVMILGGAARRWPVIHDDAGDESRDGNIG